MRITLTLLILASLSALALSDKKVPESVESIKRLFREPPSPPSKTRATIVTDYITQKIDNFDENNEETYQMRYMQNDEFWVPGGPIFIYLGGEWTISPSMISGGHFYDMASEHKAMLYYTEHRYYGLSRPTEDITTENLKWLHVKQALADVAHFIETKKSTITGMENSKVILSGGSYSATMVVWFKHLYPDLIAGGWASSAPLFAKVDFLEYKEVVGKSFKDLGGSKCYNRIHNGIAELESMFANKRGAEAKAMLRICDNFNEQNDLDMWTLFGTISNLFSGIAQYQTNQDIPIWCDYLMGFESDVAAIANFVLYNFENPACIDVTYQDMLDFYEDTTYMYGNSRPWYYQTCNEYGWYQSSKSPKQPFGTKFPATLYTTLCGDIFGSGYSNTLIHANTEKTNADFLGYDIEVENIYETHGALDPWHPMGHGSDKGANLIPKASHCNDFNSIGVWDSAEMRASKEHLAELVRQWLA